MSTQEEFIKAIGDGDIAFLEEYLDEHPGALHNGISEWRTKGQRYTLGAALHCAVTFNRPEVVRLFVEKGADVNQQVDGDSQWTPLTYAVSGQTFESAAMLVELGADPTIKNDQGKDAVEFCQSAAFNDAREKIKELLDPHYLEKKRQQKIAGIWRRNTSKEVVHEYELPESHIRLTDIFNFELRFWRALTKDTQGNGMTDRIIFFDDIPDTEILHQACHKLKALNGDPDESLIDSRAVRNKALQPKIPQGK